MAAFYSDKVMDHFTNPRNVGEIPDADGIGEIGNAKCGDIMKMYIKVKDGRIADVKFKTFGCGSAIATSSIATEMIIYHVSVPDGTIDCLMGRFFLCPVAPYSPAVRFAAAFLTPFRSGSASPSTA